ncbi:DUF6134 family protein [Methyloradius palustris]|uniref:Uncharacterized protein n=1 Tax=Methyloradius palustris TaxID=2778876 RepID=A0A8D5GBC4_9PROT|nr:DUF6134 family protein [Methyloradius palustris]BCM25141.1 hypothetical protein ZMTM_14000 [Methyloradius palustris]
MRKLTLFLAFILISQTASAEEWAFNVFLDKKPIGEHTFTINEARDTLTSKAKFDVKLLFINAYNYLHASNETWQGDCLTSIDANTNDNGEKSVVTGKLEGQNFILNTPKGKQTLPACIMTFAYWNPKMLGQSKLLNPQTGDYLDVKITQIGKEQIEVRGKSIDAEHYNVIAKKMNIDLWYSPDKEWLALRSTTPEGRIINYKLK